MIGARRRLEAELEPLTPLAIAFSGGVDSSCLLAVAHALLGERVVAVTGISPSLSAAQRGQAVRVAEDLGVRHLLLETHELDQESYAANPPDRCFFCKDELFARMRGALGSAWPNLADGSNADDLRDVRPGRRAAHRHGVRSPLAEAGLTKEDVRTISRDLGLETAELPASPCLASRLPYGTRVTADALRRVEREEAVRRLGFADFRVRHLGSTARIELAARELPRAADPDLRRALLEGVRTAGFEDVFVDDRPLRSGRLNPE